MAIVSLHNVSAFDSSFPGESRRRGGRERPRTGASTLIQMWREIEGESMVSNTITRFGDRDGQLRSEGVNSLGIFESDGNENQTVLGNENQNGTSDYSMDLGEIERQRVRQVFRGWMGDGVKICSLNTSPSPINGQSKAEWLGGSECVKLRIVKEGVQMYNEQRGSNNSDRDEGGAENSPKIEQVSDRVLLKNSGNGVWKGCRALRGLRGRQALLDLLLKAQRERQRELQSLMEGRPVSNFAYRNRIQSLLRGRFLRNDRLIRDERPAAASIAASEIGLLRQRQTVSYLREGFLSRLVHIEPGHGQICGFQSNDSSNGEHNALENVRSQSDIGLDVIDEFRDQSELANEWREINESQILGKSETDGDMNQHGNTVKTAETSERRLECDSESWLESAANQQNPTTRDNDVEEQSHVQGSENEWRGNAIQEDSMDAPVGRADSFYIPDDNDVHSVELRELLSRRRVSNLLQSGFRERLDRVIQSYVERQVQASLDWEMDGTESSPSANDQGNGNQDEGEINDIERNNFSPDTLSQTLWDSDMLCYSPHPRPGAEWEIINELRTDMDRLQQQMNNMQKMLETCLDMQIELQHSVQNEVFAALNHYAVSEDENAASEDNLLKDEPKWDNVRKGICCLCCTSSIDSLLYRCGHMCTCSKCAEKLVQEHGKCPMCKAPVAEMIQAYFIQQ
nr:zinc finger protein [Ipomoea batatas]